MAFKTVYNRDNVHDNAFRQIAANNPGFAIGEFIGDILARNYNSRGINKAVNKALEDYGTGGSLADQQAALQQVKQDMAQQQGAGTGNSVMSEMEALNNIKQNLGLANPQEQPAISVGVAPQQSPQELAALTEAPQAQPETQEQAIARLAQMPGAGIVAQENAARRMGGFDMNTAMANARQQMIKDGRTPYQIEQAMQILNPHFQKMQDDNYRLGAERIMAELGATDENGRRLMSDNEFKQRIVDLATQYGDIGKAAANVYGKDIVTGRELWNAKQQEAKENMRLNNRAALKNMDAANKMALIRERARLYGNTGGNPRGLFGNRNNGTNVKSPLDSAEFKYIDSAINKIAEIPAEDRTPEQKNFYDQYKGLRDQIMAQSIGNQFNYHTPEERGNNNANTQVGFNPNNYDQAVPFFRDFAKRGNFKKEDIAKYIRQKYYGLKPDDTSNDFVESIIREL